MRHTTWAGSPDLQNMVLAAHHPQLPAQLLACCTSGCTSRPAQPSSKHAGHLFYEHARVAKGGCRFLQASSQPATVVTRQLAPGRPAHPGRLPQQPGPLTPAAAAHCTEPRPELACVHSSNPPRSSRSFHAMRMPCSGKRAESDQLGVHRVAGVRKCATCCAMRPSHSFTKSR